MIWQLMKSLGLDTLGAGQLILLVACQTMLVFVLGYYADYIAPHVGLGIFGNSIVLFVSLWAGLAAYVHFVQPLRYAPLPVFFSVAVGSAILGLFVTMLALHRPYRI